MAITKEKILDKTHYGLGIYASILRRYYPREIVLHICGRECQPTKNPYNNDRPSLKIKVVNNVAMHTDYENTIADGNAFDFASRFYSLEGQALLERLNEDLYLRLDEEEPNFFRKSSPKITSPRFSYFKRPITNVKPLKTVTLVEVYELIRGTTFSGNTAQLRLLSDKKVIRRYKSLHFDYVTFSGIFKERRDENLQHLSNLLTIDMDDIPSQDIPHLKKQLFQDEYFHTELLFTSPSGKGIKWIISYDADRTNHAFFFNAVANYIRSTYKIRVDRSGKDPSRACFLSFDPNCYIHPQYL